MSDPEGFEVFLREQSPRLLHTAWMLTGSRDVGEDLLQESLAKAYAHWDRIESNPAGWVRTTMVRLQSAWWRRKWRGEVPTQHLPESGCSPDAGVEDRQILSRALARLPLVQRQVVVLRYVEDLSIDEVARLTGRAVGTVKSQSSRGLAELRTLLTEQELKEGAEHA